MTTTKVKTLIYDCEVTPCLSWVFQTGKQNVTSNQILRPGKIICISYRFTDWPDGKVKHLTWEPKQRKNRFSYRWSDKKLVEDFYKIAKSADVIVGHNGDSFDCKVVNARLAYYGIGSITHMVSEDTLKQSRRNFRLPSHKLDFLCKYFNLPGKLATTTDLWQQTAFYDNKKSLKEMVKYCDQDVLILEQLYHKIYPFVQHKIQTNPFTTIPGHCPVCQSTAYIKYGYYTSNVRKLRCKDCGKVYPQRIEEK